ncbi:hypothetical protein CLU79DRAFT_759030 [Phycomyces nitens]|nr:hypothetical protein CLU79DRAFT_759030 [Phycomyces nitens]
MSGFHPTFSLAPNSYSFVVPGTTTKSAALTENLLVENNKNHSLFFNERGFHNHTAHHILSLFALGASGKRIEGTYDLMSKTQRPYQPSSGSVTHENFESKLGDIENDKEYIEFFLKEIKESGPTATLRRWLFSGDLLARTLGGAFHPLIHIGLGVEFNLPGMIAEGLSMAACTENYLLPVIPKNPPKNRLDSPELASFAGNAKSVAKDVLSSLTADYSKKLGLDVTRKPTERATQLANPIVSILERIKKDPVFDYMATSQLLSAGDVLKDPKCVASLKAYASEWIVKATPQDVQARFRELYFASVYLMAGTGITETGIGLNFFLMHVLTSTHGLYHILPSLTPSESALLIHAQLTAILTHYVATQRPAINIELLLAYQSPNADVNSSNPWLGVVDLAIKTEESHVIKTVRALALGQVLYGQENVAEDDLWIKAAQLNVDQQGNWTR